MHLKNYFLHVFARTSIKFKINVVFTVDSFGLCCSFLFRSLHSLLVLQEDLSRLIYKRCRHIWKEKVEEVEMCHVNLRRPYGTEDASSLLGRMSHFARIKYPLKLSFLCSDLAFLKLFYLSVFMKQEHISFFLKRLYWDTVYIWWKFPCMFLTWSNIYH